MREFFQLAGILTLISALAGWALSYTYTLTKPTIEANRLQKKIEMIAHVLPPFDNRPEQDLIQITNAKGEPEDFYVGRREGKLTGVAFRSTAKGYGGNISMMIGVTPEGKIYGMKILEQNETPGLGNKISQEKYTSQYLNKELESSRWDVKKMGGDFDQITAATVSSRAVARGVKEGLTLFQTHAGKILKND